jgi:hypothetical protein
LFLAQHGVAYERQKFLERLSAGEATLRNTEEWVREVVANFNLKFNSAGRNGGGNGRVLLHRGDAAAHHAALAEGMITLLRRPVRLDTPAARLPETLAMDARRLATIRDEIDRLTLITAYCVLLRQFLGNLGVPATTPGIEARLYAILQREEGLKLAQVGIP